MDYYSLIQSNAVREYLQSISYRFSPLEGAWLIYQANLPLSEKRQLWQRLITEESDQVFIISLSENKRVQYQLKAFLAEYMKIQNRLIALLSDNEERTAYQYHLRHDSSEPIGSFEQCCAKLSADISNTIFSDDYRYFIINKHWLDEEGKEITALMDFTLQSGDLALFDISMGNTVSFRYEKQFGEMSEDEFFLYYHVFDNMDVHFPLPFKEGDVLVDTAKRCMSYPFVYSGSAEWIEYRFEPRWAYYHHIQGLRNSRAFVDASEEKPSYYHNIISSDYADKGRKTNQ